MSDPADHHVLIGLDEVADLVQSREVFRGRAGGKLDFDRFAHAVALEPQVGFVIVVPVGTPSGPRPAKAGTPNRADAHGEPFGVPPLGGPVLRMSTAVGLTAWPARCATARASAPWRRGARLAGGKILPLRRVGGEVEQEPRRVHLLARLLDRVQTVAEIAVAGRDELPRPFAQGEILDALDDDMSRPAGLSPRSAGRTLTLSGAAPSGIGARARAARLAARSTWLMRAPLTPGFTRPGQRTMKGIRVPASRMLYLAPRKGPPGR